jgi:hypothetical protein
MTQAAPVPFLWKSNRTAMIKGHGLKWNIMKYQHQRNIRTPIKYSTSQQIFGGFRKSES